MRSPKELQKAGWILAQAMSFPVWPANHWPMWELSAGPGYGPGHLYILTFPARPG